jgi:hypothetical protein
MCRGHFFASASGQIQTAIEKTQGLETGNSPNSLNSRDSQSVQTKIDNFPSCHPEERSDEGSAVAFLDTKRTGRCFRNAGHSFLAWDEE